MLACSSSGFYIYNVLAFTVQALVDRPDEVRRMVNFKRMVLTDFKIDIPRLAKKKVLTAALEESGENHLHLRSAAAQPSHCACLSLPTPAVIASRGHTEQRAAAGFCAAGRVKRRPLLTCTRDSLMVNPA